VEEKLIREWLKDSLTPNAVPSSAAACCHMAPHRTAMQRKASRTTRVSRYQKGKTNSASPEKQLFKMSWWWFQERTFVNNWQRFYWPDTLPIT